MSKLAGVSNNESPDTSQSSDHDISRDKRDRTISELEMSLEIERLKYRVLEQEHALKYQEMRLAGDQNRIRAIDYNPESINSQTISSRNFRSSHRKDEEPVGRSESKDLSAEPEQEHIDDDELPSLDLVNTELSSSGQEHLDLEITVVSGNKETPLGEVDDNVIAANENNEEVPAANETTTTENENETKALPEPISLPALFDPPLKPPVELSATAKSYMKIADAYLDKGKYSLASKQFLKVIRKAPDHLAAHLGYATALERAGKSKQLIEAAAAYGNATIVAIIQGEKVDPLTKAGTGGMAESILRRAIQIAQSASSGRLELLRKLSQYAHTAALAADVYHAIGTELTKQSMEDEATKTSAMEAFIIANEFIVMRNDLEVPCHSASTIQMGQLELHQGNSAKALEFFDKVKSLHLEDDDHVNLLVLSGKAHAVRKYFFS
jgi:tetratricopeptide (TPR) repeat protein